MAFDLSGAAEGVLARVITFIVVLAVVGGTIGLVFTNLGDVVAAFATPATGDATLDAIIPILGLVVGFGVVFGIVGLILNSTKGN